MIWNDNFFSLVLLPILLLHCSQSRAIPGSVRVWNDILRRHLFCIFGGSRVLVYNSFFPLSSFTGLVNSNLMLFLLFVHARRVLSTLCGFFSLKPKEGEKHKLEDDEHSHQRLDLTSIWMRTQFLLSLELLLLSFNWYVQLFISMLI